MSQVRDGLPEDLREVVDPHWLQFPPPNPVVLYAASICLFLFWALNFFGNSLVIIIFLRVKRLRTPSNILIVNLAISDLCMMTTMGLPVVINPIFSTYWAYGPFACRLYGCFGAVFGTVSLLTMAAIGYERYNVIVKGFTDDNMTNSQAISITIGIWVYVLISSAAPFIVGWGGFAAEGLLITCGYDYLKTDWNHKSFILFICISSYFLPLIIIVIYYAGIVKEVVAHESIMRAQIAKMNIQNHNNEDSQEHKIAKVAITTVLLWFVSWTPYCVLTMSGAFGNKAYITPLTSQIPIFLAKLASCLNPLVIALSHPLYKEHLHLVLPCVEERDDRDTATKNSKL
eukprot:TRINITY_DN39527_c0_g1_i1.p1 TRINITY_DN39527_c0_g1~~TRINITY_DN39527_c0_g1_i1.p1  ORF type:complete len:343 (+),score=8.85 TRINITY_DN39527_c0_g1_i1:113-1141(+)